MADVATERAAPAASSIANPAPLGLAGFAMTTFVLSVANAGLFTGSAIVLGLAFFYGGLAQFCAGMWEFRRGNTFASTAFTSYGAFWISLAFTLSPLFGGKSIVDLIGSTAGTAVGIYLLAWTIFTFLMFLGTFRLNGALVGVFGVLFLTYLFLTIGALGGSGASGMTTIGGWLGIITAAIAWYTAIAEVLSATNSAIKLPLFPMG
jgi:succinate-acetate transporter protein